MVAVKIDVHGNSMEENVYCYDEVATCKKLNGTIGNMCIRKTRIPCVYIVFDDSFCSDVEDYSVLDYNYNKNAKDFYSYGVYGNFYLVKWTDDLTTFEDYTLEDYKNDR